MKNKFLNFTLEQLLEDQEFMSLMRDNTNDALWKEFLFEHPDFYSKVQFLKELNSLVNENEEGLSEIELLSMRSNIEQRISAGQKSGRHITFFHSVLRYAALILLAVAIGTVTLYFVNGSKRNFNFLSGNSVKITGEPTLILSGGDHIALRDNSSLVIKGEKEILINKTRSVALTSNKEGENTKEKMNELVIPYGKKSFIVLEDSTKIWLCAGSRLAFPAVFKGKTREVFLEGEAYFEVAHCQDKPFYVNARDISLKVLGTRFYLSSYSDDKDIVTVLMEGSVALNSNSTLGMIRKQTVLEPGQKAVFNKEQNKIKVLNEKEVDIYIAWTKGWFNFSKENVFNVFNKLERYYNVKFIFEDKFNSDDLITGKLDLKDSITDVMVTLSELTDINYKVANDSIYVKPRQK